MQGKFHLSALAFERLAFEAPDNTAKAEYLLKKAFCYKAISEYDKALEILGRIRRPKSDTLKDLISYEKVLLHYLNGDYSSSNNEILRIKLKSESYLDTDVIYLETLNLIGLNRWEEARELLINNQSTLNISEDEINYVFTKKLKPKSPDKAFTLSMFMPGVGQMYSGYVFKGLISGGIQAVLIGFSGYSLYKGYFFTGGMTGVALFYTFYFGGARHARELAQRKNLEISTGLSHKLEAVKHKKTL